MRTVKLWAALTCPVAAIASWLELDGIFRYLAMLVIFGGGACAFILQREERAARGVDDFITLNLHRPPTPRPQIPL
jgi:hypothetical protein